MNINELRREYESARVRHDRLKLELEAAKDPQTPGEAQHLERLLAGFDKAEADTKRTREQYVEALRAGVADGSLRTESGDGPAAYGAPTVTRTRRSDPWAGVDGTSLRTESAEGWQARAHDAIESLDESVPAEGREALARMCDTEGSLAAAATVALSSPDYRAAFDKFVRSPERAPWMLDGPERSALQAVESLRAMVTSGTGSGGWLLPLSLSPSVTITGAGVANPFRQISRNVLTASSPYRATTTSGATAEWQAEGAAASDGSAVFSKTDISLFKEALWLSATLEITEDSDISRELSAIISDAVNTLEATAFATGAGTSSPLGIVSALIAASGSVAAITPTTGGVFTSASVADVYKVFEAVPPRHRGASSWVANVKTYNLIRQMSSAAAGSSFWANLGDAIPEQLLGRPVYEASAMDSAMTTGSEILVLGNFDRYTIASHVMAPALEYVPTVMSTAGTPLGARGWYYHGRVGAAVTDPQAFRYLAL